MKTTLSTVAFFLSVGVAQAQGNAVVTDRLQSGDGTVGAMQSFTSGTATSPDDVVLQQRGMATAAQAALPRHNHTSVDPVSYAPGTVGAAPGTTNGR